MGSHRFYGRRFAVLAFRYMVVSPLAVAGKLSDAVYPSNSYNPIVSLLQSFRHYYRIYNIEGGWRSTIFMLLRSTLFLTLFVK